MTEMEINELLYSICELIIDILSAAGVVYAIQDGCRICWIIVLVILLNITGKVMVDLFLAISTIIEERES